MQARDDQSAGLSRRFQTILRIENFGDDALGVDMQSVSLRAGRSDVAGLGRAVEILHRHAEAFFDAPAHVVIERFAHDLNCAQIVKRLTAFPQQAREKFQVRRHAQ